MKPYTRDIVLTLSVKTILLFLLWWFCVKDMHPVLLKTQSWFLGTNQQSLSSQKQKE